MIATPKCDILITYIPKPSPSYSKTLSGHFFEVFDYYYLLKTKYKVCVWLPDIQSAGEIKSIISTRYSLEFDYNDLIIGNFKLIKVPTVLCVDNCYHFMALHRHIFVCNKFYSFACGDAKFYAGQEPPNITLLADSRIYDFIKFNCKAIDYAKKVWPHIRRIEKPQDRAFAHITSSCKAISPELLSELILRYPRICIYSDYLNHPQATKVPVLDFDFTKFIYTPIPRKFDCSNRLIIECFIFGIPVEYWISYKDESLELRRCNPSDFILRRNDSILDILQP